MKILLTAFLSFSIGVLFAQDTVIDSLNENQSGEPKSSATSLFRSSGNLTVEDSTTNAGIAMAKKQSNNSIIWPRRSKDNIYIAFPCNWTLYNSYEKKIKSGYGQVVDISEVAPRVYYLDAGPTHEKIVKLSADQ